MPIGVTQLLGNLMLLIGLGLLGAVLYDINVRPNVYRHFRKELPYLAFFAGIEVFFVGVGLMFLATTGENVVWGTAHDLVARYGREVLEDTVILVTVLLCLAPFYSVRLIVETVETKGYCYFVGFGAGGINVIANWEWASPPHLFAASFASVMLAFLLVKLVTLPWRKALPGDAAA